MLKLAITLFAAGAGIYLILPALLKPYLKARFRRRIAASGCACLTFDDGPHPVSTPQILDLLAAAKAKATFFVLGKQAEQYPELIARIAAQGHELGEHGYGHLNAWKADPIRYALDLWRGKRWIGPAPACGVAAARVSLFRPPFGKLNLITLLYLCLGRRRLAFWDADPKDFNGRSPAEVAQDVIMSLDPGCVVLLHDGRVRPDGNRPGSDPASTVQALAWALEAAAPRKLRFATLSEAMAQPSSAARKEDPR